MCFENNNYYRRVNKIILFFVKYLEKCTLLYYVVNLILNLVNTFKDIKSKT